MSLGRYVAVSGNTGSGKSTLVGAIAALAGERGHPIVPIQERELHDPAVPQMFARPELFALGVQFAFAVNRHLALLRHLSEGRDVVAERSHLDDRLFVVQHVRDGNVAPEEADAYFEAARVLNARLPPPDAMVLLDVEPAESLRRIRADEHAGRRPHEFPSEIVKEQMVAAWHELYVQFHAEIRASLEPGRILVFGDGMTPSAMAEEVCAQMGWR